MFSPYDVTLYDQVHRAGASWSIDEASDKPAPVQPLVMPPLGSTALPLAERSTNEHVPCRPLDARAARRVLRTIAQCLEVDRVVVNRSKFDRTRRFPPDLGVRHRDQSAVAPREDRHVLHVVVRPALTLNGVQDDRLWNPVAGEIADDDFSRVSVFLTAF